MVYTIKRLTRAKQLPSIESFSGGSPLMPFDTSWPYCTGCGRPLTFFFQIAFPGGHIWSGKTLAVFHCVEHVTYETSMPYPLRRPFISYFSSEEGATLVADHALETFQRNYRFIIFDTAAEKKLHREQLPKIKYQVIQLNIQEKDPGQRSKVGGHCVLRDGGVSNVPVRYMGQELKYLMYLPEEYPFPRLADAPPQQLLPYGNTDLAIRTEPFYLFFTGYPYCFWGTTEEETPQVYLA